MKVGILGATGYTGHELVRLLAAHPRAELTYLGSSSSAGQGISGIYAGFTGIVAACLEEEMVPAVDVLFCALPHGLTAGRAASFLRAGIRVIDLGADFRLKDANLYQFWYKLEHPRKELLREAVYGLPEVYRRQIKDAQIVANPGCYPTASLLALRPLLAAGLLEESGIVIDAKSGVSGAGKSLVLGSHFSEVNENFKAYSIASHRHTPEIEQELSLGAGTEIKLVFTPHLVPMTRGILVTIYAKPKQGVGEKDLRCRWLEDYAEEPFVQVLPEGVWPQTKYAYGSNYVYLQLTVDERTGQAILVAVLDNLMKGASGQAVQNLNCLSGWPENTGLQMAGLWP